MSEVGGVEPERRPGRRRGVDAVQLLSVLGLLAAMVASAFALPTLGAFDRDGGEQLAVAPDTAAIATSPPPASTAVGTDEPPVPSSSLSTAETAPVSPATTERVESLVPAPPVVPVIPDTTEPVGVAASLTQVVSIQTVPVVRDLIVAIDGRLAATDARGAIDLTPADFDATVEIIGMTADPPIQQIEFLGWSDGATDLNRSLATIPGPVVQIGVEVRNRVVIELDPSAPPRDTIRFTSPEVGNVELSVGEPVWVVASRAIRLDGAYLRENVTYTLAGDTSVEFSPRPESTWRVDR